MIDKLNECILTEDYGFLEKYNTVSNKVSADIKKKIW